MRKDQLGEGEKREYATYMVLVDRSNKLAIFHDTKVPEGILLRVAVTQQAFEHLGALLEVDARPLLVAACRRLEHVGEDGARGTEVRLVDEEANATVERYEVSLSPRKQAGASSSLLGPNLVVG